MHINLLAGASHRGSISTLPDAAPTLAVEEHINTLADAHMHINTIADAAHMHINTMVDAAHRELTSTDTWTRSVQLRSRRSRRRTKPGAMARPGDLVLVTHACPIPALRGAVVQAHSLNPLNNKRMRFQLHQLGDERERPDNAAISRWSTMAHEVGLMPAEYNICTSQEIAALVTRTRV